MTLWLICKTQGAGCAYSMEPSLYGGTRVQIQTLKYRIGLLESSHGPHGATYEGVRSDIFILDYQRVLCYVRYDKNCFCLSVR